MFLLIVVSLLALNDSLLEITAAPDDKDSLPDFLIIYFMLGHSVPYAASLVVIIYNGLYSFKSTQFTIAKCLHYIAFGINLATILLYIFIYAVWNEWLDFLPKSVYRSLCFSDPVLFSNFFAVCVSIVLGVLGTKLYKRDKKRQLKSADSQKTA